MPEYFDCKDCHAYHPPGLLKKLWKLGWGLAFIIAMTILSECGPHTVYSKMSDGPITTASQPATHWIK
jgi:hypothetical protein